MNDLTDIFGDVIYSYTRAQALEDGVLVDVSEIAREAGFVVPVAITAALHATLDEIPEDLQGWQSYNGRLWDVLWMAYVEIATTPDPPNPLHYAFILQTGQEQKEMVDLKIHSGPGDHGEHVITIMLPHED